MVPAATLTHGKGVVNVYTSPQKARADGAPHALPPATGATSAGAGAPADAVLDVNDFAAPAQSCCADAFDCVLDHGPAVGRFVMKLAVAAAVGSALTVLVVGAGGAFRSDTDYSFPAWAGAVAGAGSKLLWDGLSALCKRC